MYMRLAQNFLMLQKVEAKNTPSLGGDLPLPRRKAKGPPRRGQNGGSVPMASVLPVKEMRTRTLFVGPKL